MVLGLCHCCFKVLVTLHDLTCSIICVNTALQSGNLKQNFSCPPNNTETKNNMITCTGLSENSGILVHFLPKLDHKELFCSCGADLCFFCSFKVAGNAGNTFLH